MTFFAVHRNGRPATAEKPAPLAFAGYDRFTAPQVREGRVPGTARRPGAVLPAGGAGGRSGRRPADGHGVLAGRTAHRTVTPHARRGTPRVVSRVTSRRHSGHAECSTASTKSSRRNPWEKRSSTSALMVP
ncbi:hypothetical protein GCM10010145_43700 [Streptomyces ruber]|uniref:Uncharacterized protein n=2 Tax=Streptomyces TaxID=1883 RepID=A0A918BHB4_9ACTN|nr:hypothetical protein GCM10010145_43700 [Streptomyces ruber]